MYLLLFHMVWHTLSGAVPETKGIHDARLAFERVYYSEQAGVSFLHQTTDQTAAHPVVQGYRAAVLMMMARYYTNPVSKWNTFSEGKLLLENLIAAHPGEIELYYIRYVIQSNAPAIVRYRSNLEADRGKLRTALPLLKDPELRKLIFNALYPNQKNAES